MQMEAEISSREEKCYEKGRRWHSRGLGMLMELGTDDM